MVATYQGSSSHNTEQEQGGRELYSGDIAQDVYVIGDGDGDGDGDAPNQNNNNNDNHNNEPDHNQDVDQDDFDLQNAIGDVFGQFDFDQLAQQDEIVESSAGDGKEVLVGEEGHQDGLEVHEELFDQKQQQEEQEEQLSQEQQEEQEQYLQHEQQAQEQEQHRQHQHEHQQEQQHEFQEAHYTEEDNHGLGQESDDDFDLSAAIGDAFAMVGRELQGITQDSLGVQIEAETEHQSEEVPKSLLSESMVHPEVPKAPEGKAQEVSVAEYNSETSPVEGKENEKTSSQPEDTATNELSEVLKPNTQMTETEPKASIKLDTRTFQETGEQRATQTETQAQQVQVQAQGQTQLDQDQTETQPEQHIQEYNEESDGELDLEAAIGSAFENLVGTLKQDETPQHQIEPQGTAIVNQLEEVSVNPDTTNNSAKDSHSREEISNQEANKSDQILDSSNEIGDIAAAEEDSHFDSDSDLDLDAAIGDAFKEIGVDVIEPTAKKGVPLSTQESLPLASKITSDFEDSDSDLDLENVIGDAFKSLGQEMGTTDGHKLKDIQDQLESTKQEATHDVDIDMEMENAISEALKSAIPTFDSAGRSNDSERVGTAKILPIPQVPSEVDISGVVQNLVNQITSGELSSNTELGISQDILKELAAEITNKVQDQGDKIAPVQVKDMPQIDDNVLEHFQNEAHKDEESKEVDGKYDNNTLQAALAAVVRNAIENNSTIIGDNQRRRSTFAPMGPSKAVDGIEDGEAVDLDQLKMNDILQNAFNMAMENPQDLISNMDIEDDFSGAGSSSNPSVASVLAKLSHPLPSSTTSFLESLNRSQDIDLGSTGRRRSITTDRIAAVTKNIINAINDGTQSADGRKKLSIAETLALHRSSMTGATRRDYSSIDSMEQIFRNDTQKRGFISPYTSTSGKQIGNSVLASSQLSNALSSISSHINSGNVGGENNLLQVIRQMTNTLSSNRILDYTFVPTSSKTTEVPKFPTPKEIVLSYKESPNLKYLYSAYAFTRALLEKNPISESDNQAIRVMENVSSMFSKEDFPLVDQQLIEGKLDVVSSLRELIISSISSFTTSKSWRVAMGLGEKPKSDTPEYKERIRMENRERKKKWREDNAERNKDNDLRSRVIKRATSMFGDEDTPQKKAWTEAEFEKRKKKRIEKQQAEEQRRKGKNEYFNDIIDGEDGIPGSHNSDHASPLLNDQNLIDLITDNFNILIGVSGNFEPAGAMAALSATTASIGAIYANAMGDFEIVHISSSISNIISSLMDSAGQKERLLNLARGVPSGIRGDEDEAGKMKESSILNSGYHSSLTDMERLNFMRGKRPSTDYSGQDSKRQRSISPNASRKTLELTSNWTGNFLKMPQYKKPEKANNTASASTTTSTYSSTYDLLSRPFSSTISSLLSSQLLARAAGSPSSTLTAAAAAAAAAVAATSSIPTAPAVFEHEKVQEASISRTVSSSSIPTSTSSIVTKTTSSSSPFISNKPPSAISHAPVGIRKPGTFQRPTFSKPDIKKKASIPFPTLYSTSFKPK